MFKDHFSGHAAAYAQARPDYPPALFAWLSAQTREHALAWDAGCGNGQAALALAAHYRRVFASDPSATQIAAAPNHDGIDYRVEAAEACSLDEASVDLITVAQALHWFDIERFHDEVRRVGRDGAVIACWCYGLSRVDDAVDAVFRSLYEDRLGPYWPPERRHIENGYADLPFPFQRIQAPAFALERDWTLADYLAYLRSWSAAQRHLAETGVDAVDAIAPAMAEAWGDPERSRRVRWPMCLRAGRIAR